MIKDIFGQALQDYTQGDTEIGLILHTSYGDAEEMPVDVFFREPDEFTELESIALTLCDGKTLDVGAGAGIHAFYLQEKGFDIDALDISGKACSIMRTLGIKNIIHQDFFSLSDVRHYDTLLFLMNGIGIAGTLQNLKHTLDKAEKLLKPGGQLLFDSSDISYLYEEFGVEKSSHYFGEVRYQYEYKGQKGEKFPWLFVDQKALIEVADEKGWLIQFLYEDEYDQYLVRMVKRETYTS